MVAMTYLVVDDGGQRHGVEAVVDGLPHLRAGDLAELGDTLPAIRSGRSFDAGRELNELGDTLPAVRSGRSFDAGRELNELGDTLRGSVNNRVDWGEHVTGPTVADRLGQLRVVSEATTRRSINRPGWHYTSYSPS